MAGLRCARARAVCGSPSAEGEVLHRGLPGAEGCSPAGVMSYKCSPDRLHFSWTFTSCELFMRLAQMALVMLIMQSHPPCLYSTRRHHIPQGGWKWLRALNAHRQAK